MTATNLFAICVLSEIAYTILRFKPSKSKKSRSSVVSYGTCKKGVGKQMQAMLVYIFNKEKKNMVIRNCKN